MDFLQRFWKKLFSGSKKSPVPPAWANFFTPEQYQAFIDCVANHFTSQRRRFTLGDGVVYVEDGKPGGKHQLGLLNLAQMCARNETKDWPEIVTDHFRTLEKSYSEQKVLEERIDDFARVAELLAVRLWPLEYLADLDRDKILHRQELPGTISALVFDLPSSIRNVTPEEIKSWGKSETELFRIGLANVMENCIPDVSEQDLGEGITLTLFSDESFFVASHALLLEEHPDCLGPFGTLVGIPHRHVMLAFPIQDLRVLQAIHMMIPIIAGMERDGPGSISPLLYWYKDGDYTNLPYRIDKNTLNFSPPEDFVEMLNLLSEP
ncbi:MAG TPA: hypothetical protein VNX28_19335 [Gemmataceae bacterium]|nr:hypothetical protein [Gemmataceae bacterium]